MTTSSRLRGQERAERLRMIPVKSDPSGSLSAALGTLAFDAAGPSLWINTDGATAWTLLNAPVSFAQYRSTDTTTNVNVASPGVVIPWDVSESFNDTANYSLAAGRVTVTNAGIYKLTAQIAYTTQSGARTNVGIKFRVNGVQVDGEGLMGYVRLAAGPPDEGSSIVTKIQQLAASDIVDTVGIQMQVAGTSNLRSLQSIFYLERLS